jgi:hypothetical protein
MNAAHPHHDALGAPAGSGHARRQVPQPMPLAVGLFNDSGDDPQVVSLAASQAQRELLRRAGAHVRHAYYRSDWQDLAAGTLDDGIAAALASAELRRVFADVDVVVVAGDTMRDRPSRHLLALLAAAHHLDIPTCLVNASIGAGTEGLDILAGLADCTVRDLASARALDAAGVPYRRVPDLVHAAPFATQARRDFTNHLVVTDCAPERRAAFTPALAAVRAEWPGMVADYALEAPTRTFDWTHAAADLTTAAVVLTGGRDGATLALHAGVPFVVLGTGHGANDLVDSLDGYPAAAADASLPLDARVRAAIEARPWFRRAAVVHTRVPADAPGRLRPGLALAGRDDLWTGAIDGVLEIVQELTPCGGSVLHAGAGQGQLVEALAKRGFRSWGTDVARRLDRPDRTRYSKAVPMALPFADHVFATVVVSADWLESLEPDDLQAAVAELTRVGRTTFVVEVSGRPVRAEQAFAERLDDDWWRRRFFALGLHGTDAAEALVTHGAGPTGGSLLVLNAHPSLCPSCQRAHGPVDELGPVHPGVLLAAAANAPLRSSRRPTPGTR